MPAREDYALGRTRLSNDQLPSPGHMPIVESHMDCLAAWEGWSGALRGEVEPDTWRQYVAAGLRFLAFTNLARTPLEAVSRSHILTFYGDHVPRGQARVSMHAALSSLFRWAEFEGLLVANPMQGIKPRRPRPKEPLSLSAHEMGQLLVQVSAMRGDRAGLAVLLGYLLGLRRKELAGIRWSDIIETPSGPTLRLTETKGGYPRDIPLGDEACAVLARLEGMPVRYRRRTREGYIVGVDRSTISTWVHDAAIRAGIDPAKAHSHILRASFATDALAAGADVRHVQKLLGHATLAPTVRYLAARDPKLREAVNLVRAPMDFGPLPRGE